MLDCFIPSQILCLTFLLRVVGKFYLNMRAVWKFSDGLFLYSHFLREKKISSPTMMHNIKPKTIK